MFTYAYIFLSDEIVMPENAPVNFGDGSMGEDRLDRADPGEIVPGLATYVPVASPLNFAHIPDGAPCTAPVWNPATKRYVNLPGTHWGNGIVLLDRDRNLIKKALFKEMDEGAEDFGTRTANLVLRSFFPGRSYVRLFNYMGSNAFRIEETEFLHFRCNAMYSECPIKSVEKYIFF
jgi:hypothetical protein